MDGNKMVRTQNLSDQPSINRRVQKKTIQSIMGATEKRRESGAVCKDMGI